MYLLLGVLGSKCERRVQRRAQLLPQVPVVQESELPVSNRSSAFMIQIIDLLTAGANVSANQSKQNRKMRIDPA